MSWSLLLEDTRKSDRACLRTNSRVGRVACHSCGVLAFEPRDEMVRGSFAYHMSLWRKSDRRKASNAIHDLLEPNCYIQRAWAGRIFRYKCRCILSLRSQQQSALSSSAQLNQVFKPEHSISSQHKTFTSHHINMSLLSLPREIRDSTYSSTLSYPNTKPTDFSVIMATVIVNDQPFHINSSISKLETNTKSGAGIRQSCRQIRAEYAQILRRAVFTPGTKTVAPVFNFDFGEMISFVKTLKTHEIAAANRNQNLVVNLFLFDVKALEARRLLQWVQLCENIGLEVCYVLQWTAHDINQVKEIEAVIGGYREGRKIVKSLTAQSVGGWNWERYMKGLRQQRE